MNKTILILSVFALVASGCNQARKQQMDNENIPADSRQADKHETSKGEPCSKNLPMSGWVIEGLAGCVEQVTYTNGDIIKFDRNGNITEKSGFNSFFFGSQNIRFVYETPLRYTLQYKIGKDSKECGFEIRYNDSDTTRIEMHIQPCYLDLYFEYKFDVRPKRSRIVRVRNSYTQYGGETEYVYSGDGFLPRKEISRYGGDANTETVITATYKYLKLDEYGNWLQCRKTVRTAVYNEDEDLILVSDETKTHELTRSIKYYNYSNK
jgi:hypothetical protein